MRDRLNSAALVALMFNLFGQHGTHASLLLAGLFSSVAALFSLSRMRQPAHGGQ